MAKHRKPGRAKQAHDEPILFVIRDPDTQAVLGRVRLVDSTRPRWGGTDSLPVRTPRHLADGPIREGGLQWT